MNRSQPYHNINKPVEGYIVNTGYEKKSTDKIQAIQEAFRQHFANDLWFTPADALHITLLDWIAPLVSYAEPKDVLFKRIYNTYDTALKQALEPIPPIAVHFNSLIVTPDALIIQGVDKGEFQEIRNHFTDTIDLLPNTKQPPTIIHSTIARFRRPCNIETMQEVADVTPVSFTEKVNSFRLIHEEKAPLLRYQVLKTYPL